MQITNINFWGSLPDSTKFGTIKKLIIMAIYNSRFWQGSIKTVILDLLLEGKLVKSFLEGLFWPQGDLT